MLILVWEKIWLKRLRFGEVELAMGVVFQHSAVIIWLKSEADGASSWVG